MNDIIDLRSDTVTRPSEEMLSYMMTAEVGDDVFGDDPTVIRLEEKASALFGMEAALFCPSGTMTNQIAVKAHTKPGDEVICDKASHVYNHEGGGMAFNSGCSVRLLNGQRGIFSPEMVTQNINPNNEHFPVTRLVVAENTCNKGGGSYYFPDQLFAISAACSENDLRFHLDGARIFNALEESGGSPEDLGKIFDSVSVCLSKGLGAPVGSLLLGNREFIRQARRIRKIFGGGMRQAGYLAAAGIFALDHNIIRLKDDHRRAKRIGKILAGLHYIEEVLPVDTNIVVFRLSGYDEQTFLEKLKEKGVLAIDFGPGTIRMVTHLDFDDVQLDRLEEILTSLN